MSFIGRTLYTSRVIMPRSHESKFGDPRGTFARLAERALDTNQASAECLENEMKET
jgi:hypothetical protein